MSAAPRVVVGFYFYPRGGSAYACRAIARELAHHELDVTLVSGSRTDLGPGEDAARFFSGCDVRAVDFAPALATDDSLAWPGAPATAPIHGSYEDRPGAVDPVLARLGDERYEAQVEAWASELERAGAAGADLLYLHHLTPLNEAAARIAPDVPIVGHVHGSELLLLEAVAAGPPPGWEHAERWVERMRRWAGACARIVVNSPAGLTRAAGLLGVDAERFELVPNGFPPEFTRRPLRRAELWRRHLVDEPRGWRPGGEPGSVRYQPGDLAALGGLVLLNVGRFTAVKRLPLLVEAFAAARPRLREQAALVLLGGHPGEWEGEHPLEAVERTGARDVFLAGWHPHESMPEFFSASDVLVHPSALEQFGQVLIEGMACGLPAIAVERGGPAHIVDDGETGWLIPPDDRDALCEAIVTAVNDRQQREALGRAAHRKAHDLYSWAQIGERLARLVRAAIGERSIA